MNGNTTALKHTVQASPLSIIIPGSDVIRDVQKTNKSAQFWFIKNINQIDQNFENQR